MGVTIWLIEKKSSKAPWFLIWDKLWNLNFFLQVRKLKAFQKNIPVSTFYRLSSHLPRSFWSLSWTGCFVDVFRDGNHMVSSSLCFDQLWIAVIICICWEKRPSLIRIDWSTYLWAWEALTMQLDYNGLWK